MIYEKYKLSQDELAELKETGKIKIYGEEYKKSEKENGDVIGGNGISLKPINSDNSHIEYQVDESGVLLSNSQWTTCYRITDKHMQITLNANVAFVESFSEDKAIVDLYNLYNEKDKSYYRYDKETGLEGQHWDIPFYNFVFKDNKCVMLYDENSII